MKLIILVACALVAVAVAAPAVEPEPEKIVRSSYDQTAEGGYNFGYETEKGSVREETGVLKEAKDEENKPHIVIVVRGTYSYVDPDGKLQTITYTADENGFDAQGDSVPKVASRR